MEKFENIFMRVCMVIIMLCAMITMVMGVILAWRSFFW
jgi:hypothetical protein